MAGIILINRKYMIDAEGREKSSQKTSIESIVEPESWNMECIICEDAYSRSDTVTTFFFLIVFISLRPLRLCGEGKENGNKVHRATEDTN